MTILFKKLTPDQLQIYKAVLGATLTLIEADPAEGTPEHQLKEDIDTALNNFENAIRGQ